MSVTIEPLRPRHIRSIMPLEERAHRKPWSAGVFRDELEQADRGRRHYVLARHLGDVAGYAGLMFSGDEAHVTNVVVDETHRRRGIARLLLCDLVREALDRGCVALTLEVRASNAAAQALYREFGFAPAGVRQRYYENTEDALVMWAHDIQGADFRERFMGVLDRVGRRLEDAP